MEKNQQSLSGSVRANFLIIAWLGICIANAQQNLETKYRMTGEAVTSAFESQREIIQSSSAVIYLGRNEIAYGTVISSDGYLLSKASELEGIEKISVRVDAAVFEEVKIVATDEMWDVALLKVNASNLVPVKYASSSDLKRGTWVIVNGVTSRSKRRVLAGIISSEAREILPEGGAVLGVQLEENKGRILIKKIVEDSGAEQAGLLANDQITALESQKVKDLEDFTEKMKAAKAGSKVKIRILRNSKEMEFEVSISAHNELFPEESRNDQMSGIVSRRRSGFQRVIQHDVFGAKQTMGGPVLNLDGQAIGMNIARANRAETFAIPVEELRELAERLIHSANP
jgi:serine protease Do